MRKLKLDLTDLEVSSFETRIETGVRGTVAGHKTLPPTEMGQTCEYTCEQYQATCEYWTCAESCYGTCAQVCGGGSYRTDCAICLID